MLPTEFAPHRLSGKPAFIEDAPSADESFFDHPTQALAEISAHTMAIVQPILRHDKLLFRIEDHEIGVIARRYTSLSRATR